MKKSEVKISLDCPVKRKTSKILLYLSLTHKAQLFREVKLNNL